MGQLPTHPASQRQKRKMNLGPFLIEMQSMIVFIPNELVEPAAANFALAPIIGSWVACSTLGEIYLISIRNVTGTDQQIYLSITWPSISLLKSLIIVRLSTICYVLRNAHRLVKRTSNWEMSGWDVSTSAKKLSLWIVTPFIHSKFDLYWNLCFSLAIIFHYK